MDKVIELITLERANEVRLRKWAKGMIETLSKFKNQEKEIDGFKNMIIEKDANIAKYDAMLNVTKQLTLYESFIMMCSSFVASILAILGLTVMFFALLLCIGVLYAMCKTCSTAIADSMISFGQIYTFIWAFFNTLPVSN